MPKWIVSALALCLMLAAPPALSDPPPHAGGRGKGGPPPHAGGPNKAHGKGAAPSRPEIRHDDRQRDRHREHRRDRSRRGDGGVEITIRFDSSDYVVVRDYYDDVRHCPPGLAKKNNGCLPPGRRRSGGSDAYSPAT